jgi:hypothetical protein
MSDLKYTEQDMDNCMAWGQEWKNKYVESLKVIEELNKKVELFKDEIKQKNFLLDLTNPNPMNVLGVIEPLNMLGRIDNTF